MSIIETGNQRLTLTIDNLCPGSGNTFNLGTTTHQTDLITRYRHGLSRGTFGIHRDYIGIFQNDIGHIPGNPLTGPV